MRVLIVEDDNAKELAVKQIVKSLDSGAVICAVDNLATAVIELNTHQYDAIVLDLLLPMVEGGKPHDVGSELLQAIACSELNKHAQVIALTAHHELVGKLERDFAEAGYLVVQYETISDAWTKPVRSTLARISINPHRDFVILCALEVERTAYQHTDCIIEEAKIENGMDVYPAQVGSKNGSIVLLPKMGLVNAAVVAALSILRYKPSILAMSGICAGVRGRTELGQVLVPEICWEYQVGKYNDGDFDFEPYQVTIKETLRQKLLELCRSKDLLDRIYDGTEPPEVPKKHPELATVVSGSSVIADDDKLKEICKQHRKILGLEMELYSIFRAASILDGNLTVLAAKGVCDFADKQKNDVAQEFAAIASAKFIIEGIKAV